MPRYSTYGNRDDRVAEDGDRGFVGFNNRLRPDQLKPGILADSQNGRMGLNGEWEVRKGVDEILTPVTTTGALTLPFTLPTSGQIGDGTTAIIDDGAVEGLYGSCAFSDPNDDASQFIVLATNSKAIAYNLETEVSTDIACPGGVTTTTEVDMIQAFNKVFIFRDGQTALEWDGNTANDFTKVTSGQYTQPVEIICTPGEFAIVENRGVVHQLTGVSVGNTISVVGAQTFEGDSSDQTSGLKIGAQFIVSKTFTEGSTVDIDSTTNEGQETSGEYDDLYKITIVTDTAHGLDVGDPIILASLNSHLNGDRFVAEVTDSTTFIIYVTGNASDESDVGTVKIADGFEFFIQTDKLDSHVREGLTLSATPVFTRKVSVGLGFTHMPAPPFAIYHQRRLVMPFNYTVDDTADSFTANGKLDEVIASDILDTDTYDQIYANFRFNAGTADFIVGLHSFSDDTLLVFNRNSIHLIQNSAVLNQAATKVLTDEVGCLARKSIQQVGNRILFLSDNGVYGIGFIEGYQLRGIEVPLSEAIDSTIRRINKAHQSKAVSVYFDNRYYLAVPLDNSPENNAILIYNFLNQQWESIDTVNATGFHITNMFVAGDGQDKGVYVVNDLGGINLLESRVDGKDNVTTVIGGTVQTPQVPGVAKTRQFTFNNLDRKKWRSFEMHVESQPDLDSNFDIDAELENLDRNLEVGTLRSFNGDEVLQAGSDVSIRGRLGNPRAYGIQLDINNTVGRPKLRAVSVDGIESFRAVDRAE